MKLHFPTAEIFIPDGQPQDTALARVTHLGIGAHQDDLEFMAFHGIEVCYHSGTEWFGGVTCTNGSGSSRTESQSCSFCHAIAAGTVRYADGSRVPCCW